MISAEQFEQELRAQLDHAASRGYKHIVINALELHVALGVFPGPHHHTAEDVMESERKPGDVSLVDARNLSATSVVFGALGNKTKQVRGVIEAGFMF